MMRVKEILSKPIAFVKSLLSKPIDFVRGLKRPKLTILAVILAIALLIYCVSNICEDVRGIAWYFKEEHKLYFSETVGEKVNIGTTHKRPLDEAEISFKLGGDSEATAEITAHHFEMTAEGGEVGKGILKLTFAQGDSNEYNVDFTYRGDGKECGEIIVDVTYSGEDAVTVSYRVYYATDGENIAFSHKSEAEARSALRSFLPFHWDVTHDRSGWIID